MRQTAIPFSIAVGPGWAARTLLCCWSLPLIAQTPLAPAGSAGQIRLDNSDMAVLESQVVHKDLPCTVDPSNDAALGFDLRFHTGYEVKVPLKELAGEENMLTMLVRVTPKLKESQLKSADPDVGEPKYFSQHIRVPQIAEDAGGEALLTGMLDIGEGKYHIDWLMRDRQERVCSFYWDTTAELSDRDRQIPIEIPPGRIEAPHTEQFTEDPPVQRNPERSLNVKVLVNFAPQNSSSAAMRPSDTLALVTLMRRIAREPKFGRFSVVAFSIASQKVLYRQSATDRIDFPALGKAIQSVEPGVVNMKLLGNKRGEVEFLTDLVKREMSGPDRPDALIFAGPKFTVENGTPDEELKPITSGVTYPLFYLVYNSVPKDNPWRDSIGRVVRLFDGKEYTISRPRDLWFSISEIVARIVESSQGKSAVSGPAR